MRLILGTAQLSREYGVFQNRDTSARENPTKLIVGAEMLGFSGLDTAPVYGEAEITIGMAGSALPVFTKLHPSKDLETSISESRKNLNRAYLDGVYLHEEYIASSRQKDTLKRLQERKSEDVGFAGVSIYSIEEFQLANSNPDIDVLQLPFNVLDRRFDCEFLTRNLDPTKKVFARSVFLQGVLLSAASKLPPPVVHLKPFKGVLEVVGERHGLDDLDVALGYVLQNEALDAILVGSSSLAELQEIVVRKGSLPRKDLNSVLEFDNLPSWDAVDPRKWS